MPEPEFESILAANPFRLKEQRYEKSSQDHPSVVSNK